MDSAALARSELPPALIQAAIGPFISGQPHAWGFPLPDMQRITKCARRDAKRRDYAKIEKTKQDPALKTTDSFG